MSEKAEASILPRRVAGHLPARREIRRILADKGLRNNRLNNIAGLDVLFDLRHLLPKILISNQWLHGVYGLPMAGFGFIRGMGQSFLQAVDPLSG